MSFNNTGVVFLQDKDFKNGKILSKDKVFVMVQGSFCHYCTQAKPDFVTTSEKFKGKVVFATIQTDGDESEKHLAKQLKKITGEEMSGVPAYVLFNKGKFVSMYKGDRDVASISKFLLSSV